MRLRFILILGAAIFAVHGTTIPCNCGLGPGYSIHETAESRLCQGNDHKLVIRPDPYISPLIKQSNGQTSARIISGESVYPPQRDYVSLCSCANTYVTPARVPPPPCVKCNDPCGSSHQTSSVSSSSSSSSNSASSSSTSNVQIGSQTIDSYVANSGCENYNDHHHNKLNQVPADPVSIALAVKQHIYNANIPRNSVADRDISFGFQKLPVEVACGCKQIINEGSLNAINGQVLELKLPRASVSKTVEEEAYEDLFAEQEEDYEEHSHGVRQPSLADLGYFNAKAADQKFVDLKYERKQTCGVPGPQCCDGFRPGKVILKEEVQVPDSSVKERETVCVGGSHHKQEHVWSSGHSNTIFKHVGRQGGCQSGCQCGYH